MLDINTSLFHREGGACCRTEFFTGKGRGANGDKDLYPAIAESTGPGTVTIPEPAVRTNGERGSRTDLRPWPPHEAIPVAATAGPEAHAVHDVANEAWYQKIAHGLQVPLGTGRPHVHFQSDHRYRGLHHHAPR